MMKASDPSKTPSKQYSKLCVYHEPSSLTKREDSHTHQDFQDSKDGKNEDEGSWFSSEYVNFFYFSSFFFFFFYM